MVQLALADTPLVASRSLGPLLGLGSLHFKVETCQPTGSWLDRSAAMLVGAARSEGLTGLGVVGLGAPTLPLAVQCARAGLRLVVLTPSRPPLHVAPGARDSHVLVSSSPPRGSEGADSCRPAGLGPCTASDADGPAAGHRREGAAAWGQPSDGLAWVTALGGQRIAVDADPETLWAQAPALCATAALRFVAPSDPLLHEGLRQVEREVEAAGVCPYVLALPALTGGEAAWLAGRASRRPDLPLPLDGLAAAGDEPLRAIVATVAPDGASTGGGPGGGAAGRGEPAAGAVVQAPVSARAAEAAQRLLAREEGLVVARRGAAALAALLDALRADRAHGPRQRRLRPGRSVVVVVLGDPPGLAVGPSCAAGEPPTPTSALAGLSAGLARLLVTPPASAGHRLTADD